ncbi:uncharacterized protein MKK02DRAFT_39125 [Dioszegia hungarica]|uniref:Uncharacterized protein n=1 Tax=Dioszegia hungarica TaxID=4972 RepID=A0AA38LS73_9TREE|nr:uncharacterized protein MKK02DRAFT_39125 [Dioszegia hungarica]KAI9633148.1 hypothetical protein MKK02DRAFT_39125 [Dioszegia hungarica]
MYAWHIQSVSRVVWLPIPHLLPIVQRRFVLAVWLVFLPAMLARLRRCGWFITLLSMLGGNGTLSRSGQVQSLSSWDVQRTRVHLMLDMPASLLLYPAGECRLFAIRDLSPMPPIRADKTHVPPVLSDQSPTPLTLAVLPVLKVSSPPRVKIAVLHARRIPYPTKQTLVLAPAVRPSTLPHRETPPALLLPAYPRKLAGSDPPSQYRPNLTL